MKHGVAAFVLLLTSGCAGCEFTGGACDPGFVSQGVPTALAVATHGGHAFIAATWFHRPDPCEDAGRIGGAIHFVDLTVTPPEVTLVGMVPFLTGRGALTSEEFVVVPGDIFVEIIDPVYAVVDAAAPTSVELVATASMPTRVVSDGNEAFIVLPSASAVLVRGAGAHESIPTIVSPRGLVVGSSGHLYVSGPSGEVAEIDIRTRAESRRLEACPNLGPITIMAANSILLACSTGGLGLLEQDGTFSTVLTRMSFIDEISGIPGLDRALVSWSEQGYDSGIFVLGTGLLAESTPRRLDDNAVFGTASAYAVAGGVPRTVALVDGETSAIPDFPITNPADSRIDGRFPGEILIATGRNGSYEMFLVRIDAETGSALGPPISVPPPPPEMLSD